MKKILLIIVLATISLVSMNAQVKYHSELTGSYMLGRYRSIIEIETIQGVKFADVVSVGIGLGCNMLNDISFPLSVNAKGFLPTDFPIQPFATLSVGALVSPRGGGVPMFVNPGIGARWKKLKLEAGYHFDSYDHRLKIGIGIIFTAKTKS